MTALSLLFLITTIILLLRLLAIKKELKNMTHQVKAFNNYQTNKKLDISLTSRDVERLAEAINDQLEMSQQLKLKERQIENQLKRAVANISHDFRTPLTAIMGYLQMMNQENLPKEKQELYRSRAETRAKTLQSQLNDFFDLSLIESPDYELKYEPVNLSQVLTESLTSAYEPLVAKGIEPKIEISSECITFISDLSAMRRICDNLISNLVKHAQNEVEVSLIQHQNHIVLMTVNEAQDLTTSEARLIFDRFFIAEKSRHSANQNTGLGLAITKSLVEKMNGTVTSQLEKGQLMITCTFPIRK